MASERCGDCFDRIGNWIPKEYSAVQVSSYYLISEQIQKIIRMLFEMYIPMGRPRLYKT